MKVVKPALIVFFSLLTVFLLLFLIPGQFTANLEFSKTYGIEQPAQVAFRTLLNPLQFPAWIPYYKGIQPISGDLITPGSMNHIILDRSGKEIRVLQTISSMENNRLLSASYEWSGWIITNTLRIEGENPEVFMRVYAEVAASGILCRSMLFWGKKRIINDLDSMFSRLAALINRGGAANPFLR